MRFSLALFVLFSCCGCGEQLPSLSGSISIDGQPVPSGMITLMPTGGGPTVGSSIENGEYHIEELEAGKYQAIIVGYQEGQFAESSAELEAAAARSKSPQEFRDLAEGAEGNNVEVDVQDRGQVLNFPLKSRK